jgi:two-component system chemotaxis sensor kinase CheA
VTERDAELDRLLVGEIERRLAIFVTPNAPLADVRAALHSLKGSAAMAGYSELALVIGQLGTRMRSGSGEARALGAKVIGEALERLRSGLLPFPSAWPEPPPPLEPSHVDPRYLAEYHSAMRDHLGEIDQVLASSGDPAAALEQAQRTVHSMKGGSAAVGDDVTAWYCHGLEARLRGVTGTRGASDALVELSRHRVLLALLIEDPARGLDRLRALSRPPAPVTVAPASTSVPPALAPPSIAPSSAIPPPSRTAEAYDSPLRVSPADLEHVFDRLENVDAVGDEVGAAASTASRMSARLAELRLTLLDATRRIGPARPWGPPERALRDLDVTAEALRRAAARAKLGALGLQNSARLVRSRVREVREGLTALRRTSMGWVFERAGSAVLRFADGHGKLVRVEIAGADVGVDRALAERLLEAVLQLARNAVAHGIQSPAERERAGKTALGTIWLRAAREGNWLRVQVEDDGQGADVDRIRQTAIGRGFASADLLEQSTPPDLMALLLLPGLTTHEGADLLAGRGLGLDVVQTAVRRFGGVVRLQNGSAGGLVATLEVPNDQTDVDVLWLEERGKEFALPVSYAGRVSLATMAAAVNVPRLAACLGERWQTTPRIIVEVEVESLGSVPVGVDRVGEIEQVSLRALPPRIAGAGPYAGAVLRADGALRLALDGPALAARARVLAARARLRAQAPGDAT